MGESSLQTLHRALSRFPLDRYPIKHASIRRQIAHQLIMQQEPAGAEQALRIALEAYGTQFEIERADTLNALGAVLRDSGKLEEAARAFSEAVALFERAALSTESGIAQFNLGLVRRDMGEHASAIESFSQATALIDPQRNAAEAGAAQRELGSSLLTQEEPAEALPYLTRAAELAAKGGDRSGLGATANLIGLARLALGEAQAAVDALSEAASAHPVGVRPESHAMAKANLSLAYEVLGDPHRARQAAHHSLSVSQIPAAVASQASSVLERLGTDYRLHVILDSESPDAWPGLLRDEVQHWARTDGEMLRKQAIDWVEGLMTSKDTVERLQALFAALLELSAPAFEKIVGRLVATLEETPPEIADQFRSHAARAAARFHLPQMERLEASFGLAS